ncbi:hypothetical protein CN918_30620 [Priestia megaterium]|nr:hypothetical protein CN918_30620 [Priestia megaterium]
MNPYRLFLKIALINIKSTQRRQDVFFNAFDGVNSAFKDFRVSYFKSKGDKSTTAQPVSVRAYDEIALSYQETAATLMVHSEISKESDTIEHLTEEYVCTSTATSSKSDPHQVNNEKNQKSGDLIKQEELKKDSEIQLPVQLPVQKPFHSYVAFHLKTTGPSPERGHTIIEMAAVKVLHGIIIGTFDRLIDPKRKLTNNFTKNTGITNEDVKGKPVLSEVLNSFYKFAGKFPLVTHNSNHGIKFLTYYSDEMKDILSDDTLNWIHRLNKENTEININQSINIGDLAKKIKHPLPTNCRTFDETLAISRIYEGAKSD